MRPPMLALTRMRSARAARRPNVPRLQARSTTDGARVPARLRRHRLRRPRQGRAPRARWSAPAREQAALDDAERQRRAEERRQRIAAKQPGQRPPRATPRRRPPCGCAQPRESATAASAPRTPRARHEPPSAARRGQPPRQQATASARPSAAPRDARGRSTKRRCVSATPSAHASSRGAVPMQPRPAAAGVAARRRRRLSAADRCGSAPATGCRRRRARAGAPC